MNGNENPKMSRSERLRLTAFRNVKKRKIMTMNERARIQAFKNVQERKNKNNMDEEERIAELELLKKELNQEISDFNRDNVFTDDFRETDKLYVDKHLDFFYDYAKSNLTTKSDFKIEIKTFNKKMRDKVKTKSNYGEKPELEEYLNFYLELYNAVIEIDCIKIKQV